MIVLLPRPRVRAVGLERSLERSPFTPSSQTVAAAAPCARTSAAIVVASAKLERGEQDIAISFDDTALWVDSQLLLSGRTQSTERFFPQAACQARNSLGIQEFARVRASLE